VTRKQGGDDVVFSGNRRGPASKLPALLAALALALVAVGCAADEEDGGGGDSGPIKIGSAVDLTGYLASFDRGVRQGAELAVRELNSEGGVSNRDLEVVFDDMKADPQQGVRSVQKLIDRDQVTAFANGFSSAATQAEAPLAERNELPMIVASVLPDDPAFQFSTLPAPEFETGVRMDYLKAEGVGSVAVLHDATPYNEQQLEALEQQADELGIRVTEVVQHDSDSVDLRPQVTRLLRSSPDAVVKLSAGPTHIVAARAMASAGARVPLLLGIEALDTIEKASAAYDQVLFAAAPPQVYEAMRPAERSDALTALVEKAPPGEDLTYVGRGYDAVLLLAEAMRQADSTDGADVNDALESLSGFEGTSGTYSFSADNHYGLATNPLFLARIPAGGGEPEIVARPDGGS
jgi:branched-chain amino acid transport system substrate-binding protein